MAMEVKMKVKICGLTNLADAQAALAAGADMLGFIFFPKSPRYVAPERVREIIRALKFDCRPPTAHTQGGASADGRTWQVSAVGGPLPAVVTVGVFVNESSAAVAQILDFCGLDLAQLHGEEPPEMVTGELRGRSYKALRPRSLDEALELASRYAPASSVRPSPGGEEHRPALLVDAYHPHLRGGTGETARG